MVLILNKRLVDKDQYSKNIQRLQECLEFEKKRLDIKIHPGNKLDVLDITSLKWFKGEIIKITNIAQKEKVSYGANHNRTNSLLYVEYRKDGTKNAGYYQTGK